MSASRRACTSISRRMPLPAHTLTTWLDTDRGHDGTTAGSAVTSWTDRMGNRSFAQGTASEQPIWSRTGYAGLPGIRFDGSNDVLTHAAAPFDGGTTAYLVLLFGGEGQTKYWWSSPDAIAGTNGFDVQLQGNALNVRVKTDTTLSTSNLFASYSSQGRMMLEIYVNLAASPDVTVITDDNVIGTTLAGTVLDQDGGQMVIGGFSDGGFADFAAADINVFLILTRPLSIGERRRMRRWARRHHRAGHPIGDWTDASVAEVI